MTLQFLKEVINLSTKAEIKRSELLRVYKVFDSNKKKIGQFSFSQGNNFLLLDNDEITVQEVRAGVMKTKHQLIDKSNNQQIGEYLIFNKALFPIKPFSLNNSIIRIGADEFNFHQLNPLVKAELSKPATWGYFNFRINSLIGNNYADFSLKMDIPITSKSNFTNCRPLVGDIETNMNCILPILSAFYLMEIEFAKEDDD